jgi:hypothetical protein
MMPEQAPLLSSYLSSLTVGHYLFVYGLSCHMYCHVLDFGYLVLYLHLFKAYLLFPPLGFCFASQWAFFPFLCLKGLVCINYLLIWAVVGHIAPSIKARWLIVHSAPRSYC